MPDLNGKRILVTGGAGMLGSALVPKLIAKGCEVIVADNLSRGRREWVDPRAIFVRADLLDPRWIRSPIRFPDGGSQTLASLQIDYVFHLAAMIGGVGRMIDEAFWSAQNAAIDWNVFTAAADWNAGICYMATACCQPVQIQGRDSLGKCFMRESDIFGHGGANPESLYGWAKTLGIRTAQAFHEEFGLPTAICVAYNMYGPFELASVDRAHVIPALAQKFLRGDDPVEIWGDGIAERCFTFTADAADGVLLAAERIEDADLVNIGTDHVVSIGELAGLIRSKTRPNATLFFDPSKPTGVMARGANLEYVRRRIGWHPYTPLADGLDRTIGWIREQIERGEA